MSEDVCGQQQPLSFHEDDPEKGVLGWLERNVHVLGPSSLAPLGTATTISYCEMKATVLD